MDSSLHREDHFGSNELIKDIVIGMSDGLTVPFALAAGISGAISTTHIVVTAGLAEIAAGSIAMGLGGYLAAKSEAEHYYKELAREEREIIELPQNEEQEVADFFLSYGLEEAEYRGVVEGLKKRPTAWRDFMMRFELGLDQPDPKRALKSAITIGLSYVAGGLVPLAPYMLLPSAQEALLWSLACTLLALLVFGFIKGHFTSGIKMKSALETLLVGGLAAAAAYTLARIVS